MTANTEQTSSEITDCWNILGVWSRTSERCPQLEKVIHCQNCDIYKQVGRSRLVQKTDDAYLQEWTDNLAQKQAVENHDMCSAITFRLGNDLYGLSTKLLNDVSHPRKAHHIPHRSNQILTGLVNIRGELILCISLNGLLGLRNHQQTNPERMIIAQFDDVRIAFPVDRVDGITHYDRHTVQDAPATLSSHDGTYIQGLLDSSEGKIGLLNHHLIQKTLGRMLR